jgi:heat-inducible transcriptional repressor
MQDLEYLGLLDSAHVSAGRIPTQLGLRLFVDGILEIGDISTSERNEIERSLSTDESGVSGLLDRASAMLSDMTHGASLVLAPKTEAPIRHIEFVSLAATGCWRCW